MPGILRTGVPGQLPPLSSCEWKATPGLVSGGGRFGSVRAGGVSTPELSNAPVETYTNFKKKNSVKNEKKTR